MHYQEISAALTKEELEELEKKAVESALGEESGIIKCNCGNEFLFDKGKIDLNYKNDEGKVINKTAATHMAANRVRCNECGNNFCVKCKVEPYHLGKNCQQYEREKNQKKCRFCGSNIRRGNDLVCTKRMCKWQARQCCNSQLECGHGCYGYGMEQRHPSCLHEECVAKEEAPTLGENTESFCTICYVQGLGEKPVIQLDCKHIYHRDCLTQRMNLKWENGAINFKYCLCP